MAFKVPQYTFQQQIVLSEFCKEPLPIKITKDQKVTNILKPAACSDKYKKVKKKTFLKCVPICGIFHTMLHCRLFQPESEPHLHILLASAPSLGTGGSSLVKINQSDGQPWTKAPTDCNRSSYQHTPTVFLNESFVRNRLSHSQGFLDCIELMSQFEG